MYCIGCIRRLKRKRRVFQVVFRLFIIFIAVCTLNYFRLVTESTKRVIIQSDKSNSSLKAAVSEIYCKNADYSTFLVNFSMSDRNADFFQRPNNLSAPELKPVESYIRRIDKHDYPYLFKPSRSCDYINVEHRVSAWLVIVINSAVHHYENRMVMRNTLGNASVWPTAAQGRLVRLVFLLATTQDERLQRSIANEVATYDDIVQEDFQDSYFNLTLKTLMGMKWVSTYCRQANFVMKMDDDVMVNPYLITKELLAAPTEKYAMGYLFKSDEPHRLRSSKWFIPTWLYPKKRYPPFYVGSTYILSTDVAKTVFCVSQHIPLFPLSDVFIGFCLEKLDVELRDGGNNFRAMWSYEGTNFNRKTIADITTEQMREVWKKWTNQCTGCTGISRILEERFRPTILNRTIK